MHSYIHALRMNAGNSEDLTLHACAMAVMRNCYSDDAGLKRQNADEHLSDTPSDGSVAGAHGCNFTQWQDMPLELNRHPREGMPRHDASQCDQLNAMTAEA